jgi:hypothetical protein
MGGSLIHREPMESLLLEAYDHIAQDSQPVGWMEYVQHLQGYDDEVSLEFTLNFRGRTVYGSRNSGGSNKRDSGGSYRLSMDR